MNIGGYQSRVTCFDIMILTNALALGVTENTILSVRTNKAFNILFILVHCFLVTVQMYTALNSPCLIFALQRSENDSHSLELAQS